MRIVEVDALALSEPIENIAIDSWDGSQDTAVIRVTTDDGLVGIGETDSSPEVVRAVVEAPPSMMTMWGLRDLLVGEDPRDIARLWHKLWRGTSYYGRSGVVMHAISGVEVALWDLLGKANNMPVHQLLGGAYRSSLEVYASIITPETPQAAAERVTELKHQGFRSVKLGGGPLGQDENLDEAIVAAVRDAVPDMGVMLDLAMTWESTSHALRMAKRLERYQLRWIEEPIWPDDVDAYVWLTSRSPVPIAAGEAEDTETRLQEMILRHAVDVVQPDVTRAGGMLATRRIVDQAARAGIETVLHCWNTGIVKAATLHASAASASVHLMEYCVEPNAIQETLTKERFPLEDGALAVPTAPGLGVTLDDEVVKRYLRTSPSGSDGAVSGATV